MNRVAAPWVKINKSHACMGSALHFRHALLQFSICFPLSTNLHRLNESSLQSFSTTLTSFLLSRSKNTVQANASTQRAHTPLPIHNALPPSQHNNPFHRHPPSPHHLNTNNQRKPNDDNINDDESPRSVSRIPNVNPPTRAGGRCVPNTTHGIPPLRASIGVYACSWLPTGQRGDAAE